MDGQIDDIGKKALTRAFNTDEAHLAGKTMADIRSFLKTHITQMLDQNPGHLMSILYRIDVRERDVKAAFTNTPPGELAEHLAVLIIDRQLEKLKYRTT